MKEAQMIDLYDALVILEKEGANEGFWDGLHLSAGTLVRDILADEMRFKAYAPQPENVKVAGLQAKVLGPNLLDILIQWDGGIEESLTYSGGFMVYWEDSALKHRPLKKGEAI